MLMSCTICDWDNSGLWSEMRFAGPLLLVLMLNSQAPHAFASGESQGADPVSLPVRKSERRYLPGTTLTPDTLALAQMLNIDKTIEELRSAVKESGPKPTQDQLVRIMFLRQTCERAVQFASLELEEALAYIDGDLSLTDLEYSMFSAKNDRAVTLNNAATFLVAGTLGVLDSASGLKYEAPVPNIFGITGNAAAVAIPLYGLRTRKYRPLRTEGKGNMLTPIFELPYEGVGYDPIIWRYLNTVALDEDDALTRKEALLDKWKKYRQISRAEKSKDSAIKHLAGIFEKGEKVTLDLLKTRRELLVDLRAVIQSMYADLSDLNSEIMKY